MTRKLERLIAEAAEIPGLEAALEAWLRGLVKDAHRADREYERFHWGRQAKEAVEVEVASVQDGDALIALGELRRVEYETQKGNEHAIYFHDFSRRLPHLAATLEGRLVIVGGSYRVTERGIVG